MLLTGACSAQAEQAADQRVGVLLLHGKQGSPRDDAVQTLERIAVLDGCIVSAPSWPWSDGRYIDRGIEESYDEIGRRIQELRERGATRIILAGQSMGSAMALSYAVYRGGVQGLILVSPGHHPDSKGSRQRNLESLLLAQRLIGEGKGDESAAFTDSNQGSHFRVRMKAAIYWDYFDPNGKVAMSKAAPRLDKAIPVLYVLGTQDPSYPRAKENIFDRLPDNPGSRFVAVNADHYGAAFAGRDDIAAWLKQRH
ncbi:MAG: alpha/beta fold hydrolase [Zoogloea sp.]|nr:alpha/beta fold hydrolase [Zoogloea sp.]